jgi:hypothetical protein
MARREALAAADLKTGQATLCDHEGDKISRHDGRSTGAVLTDGLIWSLQPSVYSAAFEEEIARADAQDRALRGALVRHRSFQSQHQR